MSWSDFVKTMRQEWREVLATIITLPILVTALWCVAVVIASIFGEIVK